MKLYMELNLREKTANKEVTEESEERESEEEENSVKEANEKTTQQSSEEPPRKRQKIIENQTKYNTDKVRVKQTKRRQEKKQPKFKLSDMVAVKIDKVDKTNPLHPNMLLGKIISIEESGFVQIVTQFGTINTLISPSRLYPCTATNVQLDYATKISFTAACKRASGFS